MGDPTHDDPFESYPLEQRIVARAAACDVTLAAPAVAVLAAHAREVLHTNEVMHLTSITSPEEFLERHLGESLEGAAMLDENARGRLIDLGSGNGYPGIPVAAARRGLRLTMIEASRKKAEFLRGCVGVAGLGSAGVLEAQVQRAADLGDAAPVRCLVCRAMGNWPKVLPRLASALATDGEVLLWGGADVETVARRAAWHKLHLADRKPLPGRERSWIWRFILPGDSA